MSKPDLLEKHFASSGPAFQTGRWTPLDRQTCFTCGVSKAAPGNTGTYDLPSEMTSPTSSTPQTFRHILVPSTCRFPTTTEHWEARRLRLPAGVLPPSFAASYSIHT